MERTTPPYYSVWRRREYSGESIAVVGTAGENFGAFFENMVELHFAHRAE